MTIEDIMNIEGIVVRKIPKESTSRWSYREGELKSNETIVTINGRKFIQTIKQNTLAGYIITKVNDQYSTVVFNIARDGLGSTIQEAYQDYLDKNGDSA